jgi:hypothetical protein
VTSYISQETDLPVTIQCRYAERPSMGCSTDTTAVALQGQWQGGDNDIDPVWVPVCKSHDVRWDVDYDTGKTMPEHYRLPRFTLPD